ncbi:MAG: DUF433 domain-containing protein [Euryarchaeota archaeon]|jgi:uncharacterized protein (DUF433 family)|nr:DUF433 domain-containing protein [Euryarchaeota archaeon]
MKTIVTDEDVLGGDPRLDGTRIGVVHIYRRYESGETPEEIAASYEGISVADVHTALAYAFDNPDEIRSIEKRNRKAIERIREDRPVDPAEFVEYA